MIFYYKDIGYISYEINNDNVFINILHIYKNKRGNNYSYEMISEFKNFFDKKLRLYAKEDMERYNKLFNLYEKYGFKKIGKESISNIDNKCYRKQLYELT